MNYQIQGLQNTISSLSETISSLMSEISLLRESVKKQTKESEALRFRLTQVEEALHSN